MQHFIFFVTLWINKLKRCIKLGWNGLPETNTQTYWAHLKVKRTIVCCEYSPCGLIHSNLFSSKHTIGPNKLECYITLDWKGLPETNTNTYWAHLEVIRTIVCCEYSPCGLIRNTSFSSKRTNGPDMLECYITQGWKGLPETNTQTYWAHLKVMKTMVCCEYSPCGLVHNTSFSSKQTGLIS